MLSGCILSGACKHCGWERRYVEQEAVVRTFILVRIPDVLSYDAVISAYEREVQLGLGQTTGAPGVISYSAAVPTNWW